MDHMVVVVLDENMAGMDYVGVVVVVAYISSRSMDHMGYRSST